MSKEQQTDVWQEFDKIKHTKECQQARKKHKSGDKCFGDCPIEKMKKLIEQNFVAKSEVKQTYQEIEQLYYDLYHEMSKRAEKLI